MSVPHWLQVKNFGPIKRCDLEVSEMLVLIGEQASGKSTLAKLVYFFKSLPEEIETCALRHPGEQRLIKRLEEQLLARFEGIFGRLRPIPPFEIAYQYEPGIELRLSKVRTNQRAAWTFSEQLAAEIPRSLPDTTGPNLSPEMEGLLFIEQPEVHLHAAMRELIDEAHRYGLRSALNQSPRAQFVPAGRSLLSTLSGELQGINSINFDPLMKSFTQLIYVLRRRFSSSLEEMLREAEEQPGLNDRKILLSKASELVKAILRGSYSYQRGEERLFFEKARSVDLRLASSGQQEALWILLILFSTFLSNTPTFSAIEEPEAHLFPGAQKEMTQFLALYKNVRENLNSDIDVTPEQNQLLITTHSPYILSVLNNLLYARQLAQRGKEREVRRIVNELCWLDPATLGVYFVENGEIRSIIDPELQLIRTEEIDGASAAINRQFDALNELDAE